eukprot:COSAG05_NODE_5203_length_1237_cov_20.144112_1_plen_148_part_00
MYATPAAADTSGWDPRIAGTIAGGSAGDTAVGAFDSHVWYQGCSPVKLPGKRVRPSSVATGIDDDDCGWGREPRDELTSHHIRNTRWAGTMRPRRDTWSTSMYGRSRSDRGDEPTLPRARRYKWFKRAASRAKAKATKRDSAEPSEE